MSSIPFADVNMSNHLIPIRALARYISNEDRYICSLSETLEFLLNKFNFSLRPEQLLQELLLNLSRLTNHIFPVPNLFLKKNDRGQGRRKELIHDLYKQLVVLIVWPTRIQATIKILGHFH